MMRILIAEDDTMSRLLLFSALRKMGHEVVATTNGHEAWQAFEAETFPLVISDWMMPERDGLELCRMVRAAHRPAYTYVMLLTMLEGKGRFLEGMRAGADDFITKPFDEEQLAARLHVAERIVGLQQEVKQLKGLLPICSYCKSIRDDSNYWQKVESYIGARTDAEFSHGICPTCWSSIVKPQMQKQGITVPDDGPEENVRSG
jgi:DNA-binding response OmpR family regulator